MKQRVKHIQDNFPIIDAHYDMLIDVTSKRLKGQIKVIENDYLQEFQKSGVNLIVCSIFIDDQFLPEMALRQALDQISALYCEIEESSEYIMLCKTYDDIQQAIKEKKIGFLLSFEGVEPLGNDINLLKIFYELGVRLVGLVWSRRNYAGDGSNFKEIEEGKKGGLTNFGIQVVRKAEELGMIVDVSHLNDEGFWDVISISKKPIIASHSDCRELCNVMRNLDDDQIKAIAKSGGVIGMNVCSNFVAENDEDKNYKTLANHVDYIAKLVGVQYVGFGFDFCDFLRGGHDGIIFDVLDTHKEIKLFIEELILRGYTDDEIKMITGQNFLNLYKKVLK